MSSSSLCVRALQAHDPQLAQTKTIYFAHTTVNLHAFRSSEKLQRRRRHIEERNWRFGALLLKLEAELIALTFRSRPFPAISIYIFAQAILNRLFSCAQAEMIIIE
jgi:hypothetical protein